MRVTRLIVSAAALLALLTPLPESGIVQAQNLPSAQVWLAPLIDGLPGRPVLISASEGYNNQPHFSPDSRELYFTAEQDRAQTDIWRYVLSSGDLSAVTQSPESEYSPTPIPGQAAVSVIRVEPDGRQRLWRIELTDGKASLLLPNVEPVGYHAWFRADAVALFILGDEFTLHRATIGDQPSHEVFAGIGRTLRRDPATGQVLFVDKNHEPWRIAAIDMLSGALTWRAPLFPGIEDFEVDSQGVLWTGNGSKLYRARPGGNWRLAGDLSAFGITGITRLAASPDGRWLALANRP